MTPEVVEDVWRSESPRVLGALLRRQDDFGACEDAAQEAVVAAVRQWPDEGVPDDPGAWLIRVASRRLVDQHRTDVARQRREAVDARARRVDAPGTTPGGDPGGVPGTAAAADRDDSLRLMLLCCHGSLTRPSQVALTLRAVAGLSVEQIAAAWFVPTRTMTQRLTRARATLRDAGARFRLPTPEELPTRVAAVLDVGHLIFSAGHLRTSGDMLVDTDLAGEGLRLTRLLHHTLPDHAEVTGSLALMLLTHARTPARTDADGELVPLRDQDRSTWDRSMIDEGVALLQGALPRGHLARFQLQAAIASVHAEADTWGDTDWVQIRLLYAMLHDLAPGPAVTLNRAVAVAMAGSPRDGLAMVDELLADPAMQRHHRSHAVRAHLLEDAGRREAALAAYRDAARLTASLPEQRYLNTRAARLAAD